MQIEELESLKEKHVFDLTDFFLTVNKPGFIFKECFYHDRPLLWLFLLILLLKQLTVIWREVGVTCVLLLPGPKVLDIQAND